LRGSPKTGHCLFCYEQSLIRKEKERKGGDAALSARISSASLSVFPMRNGDESKRLKERNCGRQ